MLKELSTSILSTLLLLPIVSCQDDLPEEQVGDEGKGRITLTFIAEPGPVAKTKAEVRPSTPGSEADKAGFSYEMVVTAIDSISPETKAKPASFKNTIALLFNGDTFNGRAEIGEFKGGVPLTATFKGVTSPSATNCRLVLVADDEAGTLGLANSTILKNFSGTYTAFCAKDGPGINSVNIKNNADIPYVGSIEGVNLSNDAAIIHSIPLFRMLAKVTLSTMINDMPQAEQINTQLAYAPFNNCLFGTKNGYDGTGSEDTSENSDIKTVTTAVSRNPTFYVGDRYVTNGVKWPQISLRFDYPTAVIEDVRVGEEYLDSESMFIRFDFNDRDDPSKYSIRRNHNYDITLNLHGTRADFIARSYQDERITFSFGKEHSGLCVGRLGGFVPLASTSGTNFSDVKGYYTKMLLLEPNTSRGTGVTDSETGIWNASPGTNPVQSDARRFWDYSYIKNLSDYGGMSNEDGAAYYYCNTLTLGGVKAGTWYVPTIQQLSAIQTVLASMQENTALKYYSAFAGSDYWSSTEYDKDKAWYVSFWDGCLRAAAKSTKRVRCVRDL